VLDIGLAKRAAGRKPLRAADAPGPDIATAGRPGVGNAALPAPEVLRWKAADARTGHLGAGVAAHYDAGHRPAPVLRQEHPLRGDRTRSSSEMLRALASRCRPVGLQSRRRIGLSKGARERYQSASESRRSPLEPVQIRIVPAPRPARAGLKAGRAESGWTSMQRRRLLSRRSSPVGLTVGGEPDARHRVIRRPWAPTPILRGIPTTSINLSDGIRRASSAGLSSSSRSQSHSSRAPRYLVQRATTRYAAVGRRSPAWRRFGHEGSASSAATVSWQQAALREGPPTAVSSGGQKSRAKPPRLRLPPERPRRRGSSETCDGRARPRSAKHVGECGAPDNSEAYHCS
jgi:hypothetical protein